jgi:hypothetical protein
VALALGRIPATWRQRLSVMNDLPAGLVLSDMRIHRQNGRSGAPAGRQGDITDAPAGRRR